MQSIHSYNLYSAIPIKLPVAFSTALGKNVHNSYANKKDPE